MDHHTGSSCPLANVPCLCRQHLVSGLNKNVNYNGQYKLDRPVMGLVHQFTLKSIAKVFWIDISTKEQLPIYHSSCTSYRNVYQAEKTFGHYFIHFTYLLNKNDPSAL